MLFLACNGGDLDPANWIPFSKTDMATIYTALHAQDESTLLAINGNEYELTFTYSEAAKTADNIYGLDKAKQINRGTGFERVVKKFYGTPEGLARAVEGGTEAYVAYISLEGAIPAPAHAPLVSKCAECGREGEDEFCGHECERRFYTKKRARVDAGGAPVCVVCMSAAPSDVMDCHNVVCGSCYECMEDKKCPICAKDHNLLDDSEDTAKFQYWQQRPDWENHLWII
jgi:hypothetical protein